ncbi:hypothetical protein HK100_001905, partial [Physocladia obscura]
MSAQSFLCNKKLGPELLKIAVSIHADILKSVIVASWQKVRLFPFGAKILDPASSNVAKDFATQDNT